MWAPSPARDIGVMWPDKIRLVLTGQPWHFSPDHRGSDLIAHHWSQALPRAGAVRCAAGKGARGEAG
jgi:hypothetical protein